MSAGTFQKSKYEDDSGRIYNIRIQPETSSMVIDAVTNAAPAGAVDQPVSARARGSRRALGVTARKISLEFTGALPTGYSGDPVQVPVLQASVFNGINPGDTGTYLSQNVRVISKTGEQLR